MKRVNTDFGLEGYTRPDNKGHLNIRRSTVFSKGKGELDFVTQQQKAKAWVPGFIYEVAKPLGNVKKNAFLKGKRYEQPNLLQSLNDRLNFQERIEATWTCQLLSESDSSSIAWMLQIVRCIFYFRKEGRDAFTSNAEWKALQTPGAIYDIKRVMPCVLICQTLVQKRVPDMKYYDTPKERFKQTKRSESPSPGAYGDIESYKKTQLKRMGNVISKYELPRMSGKL